MLASEPSFEQGCNPLKSLTQYRSGASKVNSEAVPIVFASKRSAVVQRHMGLIRQTVTQLLMAAPHIAEIQPSQVGSLGQYRFNPRQSFCKELLQKRKHADITDLSVAINEIVNEHLELDGEGAMAAESRRFDISGIDFDLLRREFAKSREKNLVLKDIQELLQERIARMLAENPSRINFYEKYQEIIRDYNQEQDRGTIEKAFTDLIRLSHELTEEEKRYIREGFENDEQLSMYDVLMKDDLSKEDIKKLKVVAKELLEKIKDQLATMDHPFDKQETRASIIITIRDILWKELPESYSDESINYYRDAVYNYVSQHYGSMAD